MMEPAFLVIGGTGKTGRRVSSRLNERGLTVRIGSRSGEPAFDWDRPAGWPAVLEGVTTAYVTYYPDLAVPGADQAIATLAELALAQGVKRLVLLSGRGEKGAEAGERALQNSGVDWTIIRASWFHQNFSENFLLDPVLAGEVSLPVDSVQEPFIDAEDIAEIAVAALTDDRHSKKLYEVTGPRLLTFAEAVSEIAEASGRDIHYRAISHNDFLAGLKSSDVPPELIALLDGLFSEVLDGRNESLADGVQQALGRPPRDFREYVQETAATGVWDA